MNFLFEPLQMNKLRGKLELGDSLPHHETKFNNSSKPKFGNKKT